METTELALLRRLEALVRSEPESEPGECATGCCLYDPGDYGLPRGTRHTDTCENLLAELDRLRAL